MIRSLFLSLLLLVSGFIFAQNYEITFTGAGESSTVDSVLVENINLHTNLTMSGNDVLHLIGPSEIIVSPLSSQGSMKVYPNPMKESAMLEFSIPYKTFAVINIVDLSGKVILQQEQNMNRGHFTFEIRGLSAGMYSVVLTAVGFQNTAKLISTGEKYGTPSLNEISFDEFSKQQTYELKNNQILDTKSNVVMEYVDGNVLIFTAYSGTFATVSSLVPTSSLDLTENFVTCIDPDDYSYSIIEFGDQIWMAENLRFNNGCTEVEWIDSIDTGWCGYYLEEIENFEEYGLLYQWSSASVVCPIGWELPSDSDWGELEMFLGMSPDGMFYEGLRGTNQGSKLAGTSLWQAGPLVEDPSFGITGFNGKPAGMRHYNGDYNFIESAEYFWSSTEYSTTQSWYRYFNYSSPKIGRYKYSGKRLGLSVRCVKDNTVLTELPIVETVEVSEITQNSAAVEGDIISQGLSYIIQRGFVWSTDSEPTLVSNTGYSTCGIGEGSFSSPMDGLEEGTVYYVRSFATNNSGTIYGNELSFETNPPTFIPTVITTAITEVSSFSAFSGGDVTDDGGLEVTSKGIVWNTLPNPNVESNIGMTVDGIGLGQYDTHLEINPATTYYVRAYAINDEGIAYGEELIFMTLVVQNCGFVEYEDHSYSTVLIGDQCWLAENLAYLPEVTNSDDNSDTIPKYYVFGYEGSSLSEATVLENYSTFGVLYNWKAATTACPNGWHLPCDAEWTELEIQLGLSPEDSLLFGQRGENVGSKLAGEADLWSDGELVQNQYFGISEFRAIPSGRLLGYNGTYDGLYGCGLWWNDTEANTAVGYRFMGNSFNEVIRSNTSRTSGHSVRCVKDEIVSELPVVITTSIDDITQHTAVVDGDVITNSGSPITERGIVFSQSEMPDLTTNEGITIDGNYTGTFSSNLVDLLPETTYYIRSYVTNSNGTGYGEQLVFETIPLEVPTVITADVSSIDYNSALSGGSVVNEQGSEVTVRGVVWGTSENPTVESNIGISLDGNGLGEFSSAISGLANGTTYYIRAYATNSVGTSYANEFSFETLPAVLPTVITSDVQYVSQIDAMSGGNVIDGGGVTITARGVVWGQSSSPSVEENDGMTIDGSGLGFFISVVEPLTDGIEYYLRAYATNSVGTSYGDEFIFSTLDSGEDGQPCVGIDSVFYESYYYQTVQHGNQCWFAENLKYMPEVSQGTPNDSIPYFYVFGYNGDDIGEAMETDNYNEYGVQYNIPAAYVVCPDGWSLPSDDDWKELEVSLGMNELQANIIGYRGTYEGSKLAGTEEYWVDGLLDADVRFGESGFNAIPMNPYGDYAIWWTSTSDTVNTNEYYYRKLENTSTRVYRDVAEGRFKYSVRCVKEMFTPNVPVVSTSTSFESSDSAIFAGGLVEYHGGADVTSRGIVCGLSSSPSLESNSGIAYEGTGLGGFECMVDGLEPGTIYYFRAFATNIVGTAYGENMCYGTVAPPVELSPCQNFETVDYGGYTYNTVKVGDQCWLAENLRYLPVEPSDLTYYSTSPRFYVYGFEGGSIEEAMQTDNYQEYGVLYNWYAAMYGVDSDDTQNYPYQGICPSGWHIPSQSEMNELKDYLGGYYEAGARLKEISTAHWICPNAGATNESLYTALPAGKVLEDSFQGINHTGIWWTSNFSTFYNSSAVEYELNHDDEIFNGQHDDKRTGASVRCIRTVDLPDVTTLPATDISQTIATLNGELVFDGGDPVTEYGIIWNSTDFLSFENYDGICQFVDGEGLFSCGITGLDFESDCFYQAYAINAVGISYGEILSFTTNNQAELPVIVTTDVIDVTSNTALFIGDLIDNGGEPETIKGFVWGTTPSPTVDNHDGIFIGASVLGEYNSIIEDLFCSTNYYVRAYATNTAGTSYGDEINFITEDVPACTPVFYDGYTYLTVQIGCQCWFEENLRYLPEVYPVSYSSNTYTDMYYVYDNYSYDVEVAKSTENFDVYGVLYTKEAIEGACPNGWKVPTDHDWSLLESHLGMSEDVLTEYLDRGTNQGSMLAGTDSLWDNGNLILDPAFNATVFNALPGGKRTNSYYYDTGIGSHAYFWTSTIDTTYEGRYLYRSIYKNNTDVYRFVEEYDSYSIRCLKDLQAEDTMPSVETVLISSITPESAMLSGEVFNNQGEEVYEKGFVWSTITDPDITSNEGIIYSGYGDGGFCSFISGLSDGVNYYVKAFASNTQGTSYGTQLDFIANSDALPPSVSILQLTGVTSTSVIVESSIGSEGGSTVTERGVIWSENDNPTIDVHQGIIVNGQGIGAFDTQVENLKDTTIYNFKSYAINSNGISYSNQLSVMTDTFANCGWCDYNGHNYKTVVIGNQCWFTEDINDNDYEWDDAMNACPFGWKLPSDNDWIELEIELGMQSEESLLIGERAFGVGGKLASSPDIWRQDSLVDYVDFGTSGFRAIPKDDSGSRIEWWTSTENPESNSNYFMRRIYFNSTAISRYSSYQTNDKYVRCMRDTSVHLELPVVSTISSSDITQATAMLSGEMSFEGIPEALEKGFVVSTSSDPAINSYDVIVTIDGSLGVFDAQAIGLQPSTQYFYRAYAKNMFGAGYGDEYSFITPVAATLPVITTDSISIITQTNAKVFGTLIDNGGELGDVIQGFVLSTNPNPDINNYDFKSDTIIGLGNFSGLLYGLNEQTTYYFKAYAYNSTGITYGDEISFTTTAFTRCGTIGFQDYYYKTILIGSQCWMGENMRYLPEITYYNDWGTTDPEYVVFAYQGHSAETAMSMENYEIYGALYNWQAAMSICPIGWHLPSDDEFKILELEIGMTSEEVENTGFRGVTEGSQLAGQIDLWVIDEYDKLDKNTDFGKSGFNCLPSGYIDNNGIAHDKGTEAYFWTSTHFDGNETYSYSRYITRDRATIMRNNVVNVKGEAVRCIRDIGFTNMEPTVFTYEVLNLDFTTDWQVQIGGSVSYDGCDSIQERGIVWSTSENPTVSDNEGFIVEGNGLGDFEVFISGLSEGVQYYYRAFATNSVGTAYGLQLSFITTEMVDGQPCPAAPFVIDVRDSVQYSTISFNDMCWFSENLRYLPEVVGASDESTLVSKYYVYDYDGSDVTEAKQTENYLTYGALYNWHASIESCPTNWHVASDDDWKELEVLMGMSYTQANEETWRGTNEGSKLAGSSSLWNSGVLVEDTEFGVSEFNILPGGSQNGSGTFIFVGSGAFFWTETASSPTSSYRRMRYFYKSETGVFRNIRPTDYGYSVRCVKTIEE